MTVIDDFTLTALLTALAIKRTRSMTAIAKSWPGFDAVERRVIDILKNRYPHGPVSVSELRDAYEEAMRESPQ